MLEIEQEILSIVSSESRRVLADKKRQGRYSGVYFGRACTKEFAKKYIGMSGIKRCLSIAAFGMLFAMIFIDRKGIGKVM